MIMPVNFLEYKLDKAHRYFAKISPNVRTIYLTIVKVISTVSMHNLKQHLPCLYSCCNIRILVRFYSDLPKHDLSKIDFYDK